VTCSFGGGAHAAHYVGALGEIVKEQNSSFKNVVHWSCPPVFFTPDKFADKRHKDNCLRSLPLVRREMDKYTTVMLGGSWGSYLRYGDDFTSTLSATVSVLTASNKRVILLGDVPRLSSFDNVCEKKALKLSWLNCIGRFAVNNEEVTATNLVIKEIADGFGQAHYIDFNEALCPEGLCSPFIGNKIAYYDNGHLSMKGSIILGKKISAEAVVAEFFDKYLPKNKNNTEVKQLPWTVSEIKSPLLTKVEHFPYLTDAENLISEKQRWSGKTLNMEKNNNAKLLLKVLDSDGESYQFSSTRLNVNSLLREKSGGESLIVSFLLMSGDRNSQFSLLRVRLKDKDDVVKDFDLMVNTNSMIYQTMGALRNDSALMKHEEDGVVATMVIPIPEKLVTASIMVYPSVGKNVMLYNKSGKGQIHIENISVRVATRTSMKTN